MGNDFLPHLPSLDIYNGAIDLLIEKYITVLLKYPGQYIVINNIITKGDYNYNINNTIFYEFVTLLALMEEEILIKKYNKKKYKISSISTDPYDIEIHNIENMKFKINDPIKLGSDNMIEWRKRYYKHYYNVEDDDLEDFVKKMVKHYIKGLKWITCYYFDKCAGWNWFYIYDHAPFLTDIVKYRDDFDNIQFILGEPMTPFEQLLTVLPKQSSYLLPECLRKIMLNCNSSISHLYPSYFELDMIGKSKYWMVLPILPDMEIQLIRQMFLKYSKNLTSELKIMNRNDITPS